MPFKLGSSVSARTRKFKVDDCYRPIRSRRSRIQRALERDSQYGAGLRGPSASSLYLYLRPYRPRATGNDAPDRRPEAFIDTKNAVPTYYGYPPRPYRVLGECSTVRK